MLDGDRVDRTGLPLLERVARTVGQTQNLLVLADVQVVLQQREAGIDQHFLELRHGLHEGLVLVFGAKTHHLFDAGAVVPAAIEQNQLLRHRKLGHITLEVPAALLPVGRLAKRHHPRFTRAQVLDDALDAAVLAGRVAPFKQNEDLFPAGDDVALQFHQLDLEQAHLGFVVLAGDRNTGTRRIGRPGPLADGRRFFGRRDGFALSGFCVHGRIP